MRCYICGKKIKVKRNIQTLFKFKLEFRCFSCKRKYFVDINEQIFPKENGLFYIYSLFLEDNEFNWLAFNNEINKWFKEVLEKKTEEDLIIWIDKIDHNLIQKLEHIGQNIYILTKTIFDI